MIRPLLLAAALSCTSCAWLGSALLPAATAAEVGITGAIQFAEIAVTTSTVAFDASKIFLPADQRAAAQATFDKVVADVRKAELAARDVVSALNAGKTGDVHGALVALAEAVTRVVGLIDGQAYMARYGAAAEPANAAQARADARAALLRLLEIADAR